jgi:hypothetical protein
VHFPTIVLLLLLPARCRAFQAKSSWFEEFEFYDNDKDEQFQQVQWKCGPTVNL